MTEKLKKTCSKKRPIYDYFIVTSNKLPRELFSDRKVVIAIQRRFKFYHMYEYKCRKMSTDEVDSGNLIPYDATLYKKPYDTPDFFY